MYFDARDGAKLGLLQLFLGTTYPGALFKPQLPTNYSDPLLWAAFGSRRYFNPWVLGLASGAAHHGPPFC